MAKAAPIITAFNAGEFSPLMAGRVDLKYYPHACKKIRNFILTQQGPARRRPGTRFVAEVKDSGDYTWLSKFEFNAQQAYVLEIGDLYIRFFANHGVVGAPFEVVTPYSAADLVDDDGFLNLRSVQSNDVVYLCHPDYPTQKLTRTGAATFTLAALEQEGGPFKEIDPDTTTTVYASAATGTGQTLTASAAIFLSTHVGSLFYLEQKNINSVEQWEPGQSISTNDVRRSDGKNYHALNTATTGTIRPTHSRGAVYDGDGGVQWQFDDPGYGWCKITAIGGGGTTATVNILSRIPDNAVGSGNASTRWAHGAWSAAEGYPTNVTFFKERLTFSRGQTLWGSVSGDYENFRARDDGGLITLDSAYTIDITSDRSNSIEWLAPSDKVLLVGTAGDEHVISTLTDNEPFGPGNITADKQTEYGSRHVRTVRVGDGVAFVQKAGRKVRSMAFSLNKDKYDAQDQTIFAEHITKGGIIDMAYQQEPDSNLWGVRYDGALLGLTLNPDQDVRGWHPHRIGGYSNSAGTEFAVVESITDIPSPDGDRNEVWMVVRRYINGGTKRYIEWMEYHHEEGDDREDAFYMDCGLTLDNTKNATLTPGTGATVKGTTGVVFAAGSAIFSAVGADIGKRIHYRYSTVDVEGNVTWQTAIGLITANPDTTHVSCTIIRAWPSLTLIPANYWRMTVTTITGAGHLEGQTVQVIVDGASHPDRVVSSGGFALDVPASKVHMGLKCTAVLQPMPIEAGAADGTAQTKTTRISRLGIRFHETLGAKYGRSESGDLDQVLSRSGETNMDEAPPLFTGDVVVAWPDGYEGNGLVSIVQDQGHPCTVVALVPQITTQDAR